MADNGFLKIRVFLGMRLDMGKKLIKVGENLFASPECAAVELFDRGCAAFGYWVQHQNGEGI